MLAAQQYTCISAPPPLAVKQNLPNLPSPPSCLRVFQGHKVRLDPEPPGPPRIPKHLPARVAAARNEWSEGMKSSTSLSQ